MMIFEPRFHLGYFPHLRVKQGLVAYYVLFLLLAVLVLQNRDRLPSSFLVVFSHPFFSGLPLYLFLLLLYLDLHDPPFLLLLYFLRLPVIDFLFKTQSFFPFHLLQRGDLLEVILAE